MDTEGKHTLIATENLLGMKRSDNQIDIMTLFKQGWVKTNNKNAKPKYVIPGGYFVLVVLHTVVGT